MQVAYIFHRKQTDKRDAAALLTYTLPGGLSMGDRLIGNDPHMLQHEAISLLRRTVPAFDTCRLRVVVVPVSAAMFQTIDQTVRG